MLYKCQLNYLFSSLTLWLVRKISLTLSILQFRNKLNKSRLRSKYEEKGSHLSSDSGQERIQFLQPREDTSHPLQRMKKKLYIQTWFCVFDLNTLNLQVLFSINVLLAMGVSQHKKYARLPAAVQEMSPRPSSSFLFSLRKKTGPERAGCIISNEQERRNSQV